MCLIKQHSLRLPHLGGPGRIQMLRNNIVCTAFPFQNLKFKFSNTEIPLLLPYPQRLPISKFMNRVLICHSFAIPSFHTTHTAP